MKLKGIIMKPLIVPITLYRICLFLIFHLLELLIDNQHLLERRAVASDNRKRQTIPATLLQKTERSIDAQDTRKKKA